MSETVDTIPKRGGVLIIPPSARRLWRTLESFRRRVTILFKGSEMDPIIVDVDVIKDIARGHRKAADALLQHRKSGREITIAQAAYKQLTAPMPQDSPHLKILKTHYREIVKDFGIKIAPPGSFASRVDVYAANPVKGQTGHLQEYDKLGRPGDMFIGAQAKATKYELWTHDAQFAKRAQAQGIKLAPECSLGGQSGVELPQRARKWLGLKPISVSPNGTVRPLASGPVGGGRGTTPIGVGAVGRVGAGRLGPGVKAVGGSLILVGVGLLVAYLRGKLDQAAIEKQMKDLEPKLQSLLKAKVAKLEEIQSKGCTPFANITIPITVECDHDPEGGDFVSLPWLERDAVKVDISDQVLENTGMPVRQIRLGGYSETTAFTYSVELSGAEAAAMGLPICKPPLVQLTSDTEIREWLARSSPSVVRALTTQEKIRMINRLLDGWISHPDVEGIDKICTNVANSGELATIRRAIQPRETSISDHGQRLRVRAALYRHL